jgi:hypothetical protein
MRDDRSVVRACRPDLLLRAYELRVRTPFTDDEWAPLAAQLSELPRPRDLQEVRQLIASHLNLYALIEALNLMGLFSARVSDDGSVEVFILENIEKHRRLAKAIREVIDAYEPSLLPLDDSRSIEELSSLKDQLQKRAEYSESEVDLFEQMQSESAHRGVKRDRNLSVLVESLIDIWTSMGGRVGASNNAGRGGPLIRFLQTATRSVLFIEPSVEAVRGWVRNFKKTRTARGQVALDPMEAMLREIWPARWGRPLGDIQGLRREAAEFLSRRNEISPYGRKSPLMNDISAI